MSEPVTQHPRRSATEAMSCERCVSHVMSIIYGKNADLTLTKGTVRRLVEENHWSNHV
jgi:hypothetical protein